MIQIPHSDPNAHFVGLQMIYVYLFSRKYGCRDLNFNGLSICIVFNDTSRELVLAYSLSPPCRMLAVLMNREFNLRLRENNELIVAELGLVFSPFWPKCAAG